MAIGIALLLWHYPLGACLLLLQPVCTHWAAAVLLPLLDLGSVSVVHLLQPMLRSSQLLLAAQHSVAYGRVYNLLQLLLRNRSIRLPTRALLECLPAAVLQVGKGA